MVILYSKQQSKKVFIDVVVDFYLLFFVSAMQNQKLHEKKSNERKTLPGEYKPGRRDATIPCTKKLQGTFPD